MRIINFKRDREFYDRQERPPQGYGADPLDSWRHGLAFKLVRQANPFNDKKVLNIGGGWGREARMILSQHPRYLILSDCSLPQIGYAKDYLSHFSNKYFICADGEKIPLKDKSVDVCLIEEALHHFIDPSLGIGEMLRVSADTVIIDEPRKGTIRNIMNWLFVKLGIKEGLERGYLEAYRVNKKDIRKFRGQYKKAIFFPYFIYYFKWYKRTKNRIFKKMYLIFLIFLNLLFHSFGNRLMVVLRLREEG